jgi:SAM-dependent methyltransferase
MNPREFSHRWLSALVGGMDRLNQRHPWIHNDHFHGWILRHLPDRRRRVLDVGCGRGKLLEKLAAQFEEVHGTDLDAGMRAVASQRVARHTKVTVTADQLPDIDGTFDLITMIACLHHMDADSALVEVRRLLAPAGRLIVVGLARPESRLDWAWDVVCLLTNPLIGLAKHPHAVPPQQETGPEPPTVDPTATLADLKEIFGRRLPGARLQRRIGFRYTAMWTKTT